MANEIAGAKADFDKDEAAVVEHDEIEFAQPAAKVSGKRFETACFEKS